jgi:eukaryotic-like serine/threonine-protein kinase
VEEATRIAREVADALDYANRQGIVHRDVKPENILLHEGRALVADFGIALAVSRADGGARMTETGMSLGTPHYMAPEQAVGEREITGRADVFALGCVLYECLTGEPPFTGPTAQATLARVLMDEPRDLRSQRRTVPANVEAAVRTALEKLPADRFPTAAAFAEALGDPAYRRPDEARVGHGAPTAAAGPAWDPRAWPAPARSVAAVLAVTAAAFGAAWLAAGDGAAGAGSPLPVVAFEVPDGPDSFEPIGVSVTGAVAWSSPEGIRLRPPGALAARLIPGTASEYQFPFDFSPDGESLVFQAGSTVRRMPVGGGAAQTVVSDIPETSFGYVRWGEDDHIYLTLDVFSTEGDPDLGYLLRVPATGGSVDTLLTLEEAYLEVGSLLPGHRTLLLGVVRTSRGQAPDGQRAVAFDLERRDTVSVLANALSPQWSPTGHVLAAREDGTLIALPFDPGRVRATGSAVTVADSVSVPANLFFASFRLGPGGTLAYLRGPSFRQYAHRDAVDYRIGLITDAGDFQELPLPPTTRPAGAISPDGRRLAYTRSDGLWLFDLATGTHRALATELSNHQRPVWSSDGRRIAFAADEPDVDVGATRVFAGQPTGGVYALEPDGDTTAVYLGRAPGDGVTSWPGQWLNDGTLLLTAVAPSGRGDLYRIGTDGDPTPLPVLNADWNERYPQASPDGRWIAYASDEASRFVNRIYVRRWPDLSRQTELPASSGGRADQPVWSPDGRTLWVAMEGGGSPPRVVAYELEERADGMHAVSERVVLTSDTRLHTASTNPDGRLLAFISTSPELRLGSARLVVVSNWLEALRER